jgi:small subunit ribosomal protein S8
MQTVIDLVIRIKNGYMAKRQKVVVPASKVKQQVLDVLVASHYIRGYEVRQEGMRKVFDVSLAYDHGAPAVTGVKVHSKPGQRVYVGVKEIPKVLSGLGICVITTPKGVLAGHHAKKLGTGGELLFSIW